MKTMVTPKEALQIVLSHTRATSSEEVAHQDAPGRTLARDVVSRLDLPPFDNSAMDGYAVVASDLITASEASPVALRVLETTAAGAAPQHVVASGACSKVMTGAPLPAGADAVVMREETRETTQKQASKNVSNVASNHGGASIASGLASSDAAMSSDAARLAGEESVWVLAAARAGQNIRRAGSDVRRGETVMRAGEKVQSAQWAMLASLGEARVEVCRQPRVAILTTGDELVEVGAELLPGQIRDSNSFALDGLVQSCGGVVVARRHLRDDAEALRQALLECAQKCDAIITSGGVSMGDFDPVRDVLPTVADIHFWKIAMKPGKPVMFATMHAGDSSENGASADSGVDFDADSGRDFSMRGATWPPHEYSCGGHVPVFGLPGNPVSVMVAFEQFVRPCLLAMQNRKARRRVMLQARVLSGFSSPPNRVEWVRALVLPDASSDVCKDEMEANRWSARVAGDQGSGRLSTMTGANALLLVPADVARVESGDFLSAQMTDWPEIE